MAEDERYNGYANFATWGVALYIDNESNECIHEAWKAAQEDKTGAALREWFERYFLTDPETEEMIGNPVVQHFLNSAMDEVNWYELRQGYYEEAKENGLVEEDEEEGSWDDDPELRKALGMSDD